MRAPSIRDNLLVTAGARAAYMECLGLINIPKGLDGEDELARYISNAVDDYMGFGFDCNFDEYIETLLSRAYSNKHVNL